MSSTIAPLSTAKKTALRPLASGYSLAAAVFAGVAIALAIAVLAPYPGTQGDPIMKVLSFTVSFAVLATAFKVIEVLLLGQKIEKQIGTNRKVELRGIFNRDIRAAAVWGGMLQAAYVVVFIMLITKMAPTALASARACVVFALAILEVTIGLIPRERKPMMRLALSLLVTFGGAGVVIFANGFQLFHGESGIYLWLFLGLIGPGNFVLAFAEWAEMKGVHKRQTSAPVYTLARFVAYAFTCVVAMVAWGLTHGGFGIFSATIHMVIDRWYFLIPLSLLWGLTDLLRICVKTVIPATYMYVIGSLSVVVDALTQSAAKHIAPKVYIQIPGSMKFMLICIAGGLLITLGAWLFPHAKKSKGSNQPQLTLKPELIWA